MSNHPLAGFVRELRYPTTLAYDKKQMKPGCALVQAGLGGDARLAELMIDYWLLAPTPDMELYTVKSPEEALKILDLTEAAHAKKTHA